MLVAIQWVNAMWEVTALEGRFEESLIARVDGIALTDAIFAGEGIITGMSNAVWGALVEDRICTDRNTIFGLGINRPFDMRPNRRALFNGEIYVDERSGRSMVNAAMVTAFHDSVFYWGHK